MPETLPKTRALLDQGIADGLHLGAQVYVSVDFDPVADFAVGEARSGRAMATDDLTLWMSSTKPTAAAAFARFWERGDVALDDRVARFIPEFASGGKDAITLRHVLTHTGGFRMLKVGWPEKSWDEIIATICTTRLEPRWTPGERAGYHLSSSWFILGEVLRRLDSGKGKPYHRIVRDEVFEPLGMNDSWVGMPAQRYESYGDRIVPMFNTEKEGSPAHDAHLEESVIASSPGGNGRGPARDLGRFYEAMLGLVSGDSISPQSSDDHWLRPQTAEALVARHRVGMLDKTFRAKLDWGLGFIANSAHYEQSDAPYGYGPHASHRTFGHSGYRSSTAFADPHPDLDHGLVVVMVTNGTPAAPDHHRRFVDLTSAVYEDLALVGSEDVS